MSDKKHLTAIIHAQKNTAALTDDEYRMVLYGATGKTSCTECTAMELQKVYTDLNEILEKKGLRKYGFPRRKSSVQTAAVMRAKKVFGADWQTYLDGFLRKIGADNLASCTDKQIRRVMAYISAVERRQKC